MISSAETSTSDTKGERTRLSILQRAVDIASAEGLEGLSIGRLSAELGMSKSGLFAHFGSKEELQLATVDEARRRFIDEVFLPSLKAPRGLPRLERLCRDWLSYARREVFPGGCFFVAASAEFDGRPGPVRDRIAAVMEEWLEALRIAVVKAQESGDINDAIDPRQLAFEINAMMMAANWAFQLYHQTGAFTLARRAIESRLAGARSAQRRPRSS